MHRYNKPGEKIMLTWLLAIVVWLSSKDSLSIVNCLLCKLCRW